MARLIDAMQTVIKMSGRITPLIQMGANPIQVYNEMLQVVAEAQTVDAVEVVHGRWIPVKERLPEHGDVVLCFMKFGEHRILQWDNVSSLWLGYGHGDDWQKADVTNWMPLPEPPKEDNCEILQRLCWL